MKLQHRLVIASVCALGAWMPLAGAQEWPPADRLETRSGVLEFEANGYPTDATGEPLKGDIRYRLRFPPGPLPPVNAFWSVTMYDLPDRFLVANPLNRHLIDSPMLPPLKRDADGGLTLHVQHESPGEARESNWLPAPSGPFFLALCLYLLKDAAFDGTRTQPPLKRQPD